MRKISTGIYGLNRLLDGGFNANSTTVVIGTSGAGKTTMATQYIRRGLEIGQEGIFVSLDENKEQIIREAVEMGWSEILDYIQDDLLVFIDASGKDFSKFIKEELAGFVSEWGGSDARIVIDPLTPVLWSSTDRYVQRDLIGFLLKETRRVGTVLCTLEEHGVGGDLSGPETIIPMYLADSVIHLRYIPHLEGDNRTLKIIKARSSRHSEEVHPYQIIRGIGIAIGRGRFKRSDSRDRVEVFGRKLLTKMERLPSAARRRLESALEHLVDDDLGLIDTEALVEDILHEYKFDPPG